MTCGPQDKSPLLQAPLDCMAGLCHCSPSGQCCGLRSATQAPISLLYDILAAKPSRSVSSCSRNVKPGQSSLQNLQRPPCLFLDSWRAALMLYDQAKPQID